MAVIDYSGVKKYEGCVLELREYNGRDDSDFYAVCVDTELGEIVCVEYATTRAGGGGDARIDITEENYRAYLKKAYQKRLETAISCDRNKAKEVAKGKMVVVVRGRKVPLGTVGELFWEHEENYSKYHNMWSGRTVRIGIKDKDGNVWWTYKDNVEVADSTDYCTCVKELRKRLKQKMSREYSTLFRKAKTQYV